MHVSVGVLIFDRIAGIDHLLYGWKLSHPAWGAGWEFSGGKHDVGETVEEAAKREVLEETGLIICEPQFLTYVQDMTGYLCLMFAATPVDGELELREPHKHREWQWHPVDQPPTGLIWYCQEALQQIGQMYDGLCFHKKNVCPMCGSSKVERRICECTDCGERTYAAKEVRRQFGRTRA